MSRRRFFLFAAGLTVAAVTSACSSSPSRAQVGQASPTAAPAFGVSVSNATDPYVIPWLVGKSQKLFEKHGVSIDKIVSGAGGTTTLQTQLSGDLPVGDVSYPAVVQAKAKGVPVVAVGGATQSLYGLDFYTMASSNVHAIGDVKSWAFTNPGSVTQALTYLLPERAGIGDTHAQRVAAGGIGQGIALLEGGKVDATVIPASVVAAHPGKYRLVVASDSLLTSFQQSVITTTTSFAQAHPDQLKAVLAGYNDSVAWISSHVDETAQLYADQTHIPVDTAKSIIEGCLKARNWGVGINVDALNNAAAALKDAGYTGKIDYCAIFNTTFLPKDVPTTLPSTCGS